MLSKEDYVSVECAKLLKEKGFDEWCDAYYHLYDKEEIEAGANEDDSFEVVGDGSHSFKNSDNHYRVGAPTLYEAQKWLRKNHKQYVCIENAIDSSWNYFIENIDCTNEIIQMGDWRFTTYESALNAGISKALKCINE